MKPPQYTDRVNVVVRYIEKCSINETDYSILSLHQYIEHNNIERVQWTLFAICVRYYLLL